MTDRTPSPLDEQWQILLTRLAAADILAAAARERIEADPGAWHGSWLKEAWEAYEAQRKR